MNISDDILFIYDDTVMKTEYDSLEDAVIFLNPKDPSRSDDLLMFLGQLVGMVSFTKTFTGSIPTSLKLEHMKFAIMQKSHFFLFLGCRDLTQPESYLKRKLQRFMDVFTFYNGSFDRLLQLCGSKESFLSQLDLLCRSYLLFIHCYLNSITSIFYPIPHITFNKATSIIFLKVAQVLEAYQRENSVLCGCLFSEERLVYSQLPDELVHHLLLLKPQQNNLPAKVFYPGFECPLGVAILCIYVTVEQYNQIVSASLKSPYKIKQRRKLRSLSELSESLKDSRFSEKWFDKGNEFLVKSRDNVFYLKSQETNSFKFNREKRSSFNGDSYDTVDNSTDIANKPYVSKNEPTKFYFQDAIENNFQVDSCEGSDVKSNSSAIQEISEKYGISTVQPIDETIELHLYVQAHSSSTLLLLMTPQASYTKDELKKLWEMSMPQLGDIEAQVKSLISSEELHNAKTKHENKFCYLSYQKVGCQCDTNIKNTESLEERLLVDTINTLHNQFVNSPQTTEITLKNHLASVHGKQTEAEEVFYQPINKQRSRADSSPFGIDMIWSYDIHSLSDMQNLRKKL